MLRAIHPTECDLCHGTLIYMRQTAQDEEKITMSVGFCPRLKEIISDEPMRIPVSLLLT